MDLSKNKLIIKDNANGYPVDLTMNTTKPDQVDQIIADDDSLHNEPRNSNNNENSKTKNLENLNKDLKDKSSSDLKEKDNQSLDQLETISPNKTIANTLEELSHKIKDNPLDECQTKSSDKPVNEVSKKLDIKISSKKSDDECLNKANKKDENSDNLIKTPSDKTNEKTSHHVENQNLDKIKETPSDKTDEITSQHSKEINLDKIKEPPSDKTNEKTSQPSKESNLDKIKEQPSDKMNEKTSQHSKERNLDNKNELPSEKTNETTAQHIENENLDKINKPRSDKNSEKTSQHVANENLDKIKELSSDKTNEKISQHSRDRNLDKKNELPSDKMNEKTSQHIENENLDKIKEPSSDKSNEKISQHSRDRISDKKNKPPSDKTNEKTSHHSKESNLDKIKEQPSDKMNEKSSQHIENENLDKIKEPSSDKTNEKISQHSRDRNSDKKNKPPSDKTSEKALHHSKESNLDKIKEQPSDKMNEKTSQHSKERNLDKKNELTNEKISRQIENKTSDNINSPPSEKSNKKISNIREENWDKLNNKPLNKSINKTLQAVKDKNHKEVNENPSDKLNENPPSKTSVKPSQSITDVDSDKLNEKTLHHIEDKNTEKLNDKPSHKSKEKSLHHVEHKTSDKLNEKLSDKLNEKTSDKSKESTLHHGKDNNSDKLNKNTSDKLKHKTSKQFRNIDLKKLNDKHSPDKSNEKTLQSVMDKNPHYLNENTSDKSKEKNLQNIQDKKSNKFHETPSDKLNEKHLCRVLTITLNKLEDIPLEELESQFSNKSKDLTSNTLDKKALLNKFHNETPNKVDEKSSNKSKDKSLNKADIKILDKSEKKTSDNVEKKISDNVEKKTSKNVEKKTSDKSPKEISDKSEHKTSGRSERKPSDRLEKKIADRPENITLDKVDKKISDKSENKDRSEKKKPDKAENRSSEKSEKKTSDKTEKKTSDKAEKEISDKSEKKKSDKSENKTTNQLKDKASSKTELIKTSDNAISNKLDNKASSLSDKSENKSLNKMENKASNKAEDKTANKLKDKSSSKIEGPSFNKSADSQTSSKSKDKILSKSVEKNSNKPSNNNVQDNEFDDKYLIWPEDKVQIKSDGKTLRSSKNKHSEKPEEKASENKSKSLAAAKNNDNVSSNKSENKILDKSEDKHKIKNIIKIKSDTSTSNKSKDKDADKLKQEANGESNVKTSNKLEKKSKDKLRNESNAETNDKTSNKLEKNSAEVKSLDESGKKDIESKVNSVSSKPTKDEKTQDKKIKEKEENKDEINEERLPKDIGERKRKSDGEMREPTKKRVAADYSNTKSELVTHIQERKFTIKICNVLKKTKDYPFIILPKDKFVDVESKNESVDITTSTHYPKDKVNPEESDKPNKSNNKNNDSTDKKNVDTKLQDNIKIKDELLTIEKDESSSLLDNVIEKNEKFDQNSFKKKKSSKSQDTLSKDISNTTDKGVQNVKDKMKPLELSNPLIHLKNCKVKLVKIPIPDYLMTTIKDMKKNSSKDKNVSKNDSNLSVDDKNKSTECVIDETISLEDKNLSIENKILSIEDKNVSFKNKIESVEDKSLSMGDKIESIEDKNLSIEDKIVSTEDKTTSIENKKLGTPEKPLEKQQNETQTLKTPTEMESVVINDESKDKEESKEFKDLSKDTSQDNESLMKTSEETKKLMEMSFTGITNENSSLPTVSEPSTGPDKMDIVEPQSEPMAISSLESSEITPSIPMITNDLNQKTKADGLSQESKKSIDTKLSSKRSLSMDPLDNPLVKQPKVDPKLKESMEPLDHSLGKHAKLDPKLNESMEPLDNPLGKQSIVDPQIKERSSIIEIILSSDEDSKPTQSNPSVDLKKPEILLDSLEGRLNNICRVIKESREHVSLLKTEISTALQTNSHTHGKPKEPILKIKIGKPPLTIVDEDSKSSVFSDENSQDGSSLMPELTEDEQAIDAKHKALMEPFLQHLPCFKLRADKKVVHICRECRRRKATDPASNDIYCRFFQFRRLKYDSEGKLFVAGFPNPFTDPKHDDIVPWQPDEETDPTAGYMDIQVCRYILLHVGDQFCYLWRQEAEALELHENSDDTIAWKKAVQGIREICDVCDTTLFNFHWTCSKCGFGVCIDCFKDRKQNITCRKTKDKVQKGCDDFHWLYCTASSSSSKPVVHRLNKLMLTQIIPGDSLAELGNTMHFIRNIWKVPQICHCLLSRENYRTPDSDKMVNEMILESRLQENTCESSLATKETFRQQVRLNKLHEKKAAFAKALNINYVPGRVWEEETIGEDPIEHAFDHIQHINFLRPGLAGLRRFLPPKVMMLTDSSIQSVGVPHDVLCNGKLLLLTNPINPGNRMLFQDAWKSGQPIMISNVSQSLDLSLWRPEAFCRDFGDKPNDLINCLNGNLVPNQPMKHFWEGFQSIHKRLLDVNGQAMLLKLKDWPPGDDFAEILPTRYADLMNGLPMPEYTLRTGNLNLASCLPKMFVPPDLGPKMYNAYGSALYPNKGTTNLHLDISDAVNIMVYVGIPEDSDGNSQIDAANKAITLGSCDYLTRQRLYSSEEKPVPGALWHIFSAQDADKIRDLLNRVTLENGFRLEPDHDPIHDQNWYLDDKLRARLYNEYQVECYPIVQCLGDAVFIPAGAPHQVQNLHNCIKVAEDFVSPENITHCVHLTHEFRRLSSSHTNHEDKLQIKNIIYHAVKDCCTILTRALLKHTQEKLLKTEEAVETQKQLASSFMQKNHFPDNGSAIAEQLIQEILN